MEKINTFGSDVLAYPNPARDKVNFALQETQADEVIIEIYNISGERVSRIQQNSPGQVITWETKDIAPGIYLYQTIIKVGGQEKRLGIKKISITH
jgi:hypothetical protein